MQDPEAVAAVLGTSSPEIARDLASHGTFGKTKRFKFDATLDVLRKPRLSGLSSASRNILARIV